MSDLHERQPSDCLRSEARDSAQTHPQAAHEEAADQASSAVRGDLYGGRPSRVVDSTEVVVPFVLECPA